MATIVIPWRKGSYCARLDGHDPKYGLAREFENGRPIKSGGGTLTFELAPGWYEVRERWGAEREYYAVDELRAERIPSDLEGFIGEASEGPSPGLPGAWNSDQCACGKAVAGFDPSGFPLCSAHEVEKVAAVGPALVPA